MSFKIAVKTGLYSLCFIAIFQTWAYQPNIENIMKAHPFYITIGAIALIASLDKILEKIGIGG